MNLPPYPVFPTLIADDIILRHVLQKDVNDLTEITLYEGQQAQTEKEAKFMLDKIELDYLNGICIHWVIANKSDDLIMGTCGYYRGLRNGKGELGCNLKLAFRGRGFMTSAIQCAIDFGIEIMELHKIIAITTRQNLKAISVLQRLQFIQTLELDNSGMFFELGREQMRR